MIITYEYVHVQISPMLFCVDVLIIKSAYRNRGLFLGRYCDVSAYRHIYCCKITCTHNNINKINAKQISEQV